MAFMQYLNFNGTALPLPDSYDLDLSDIEADSSGETEAGTTQRDVVRTGVVKISVSFSVSPKWLKQLTAYSKLPKLFNILIPKIYRRKKQKCISADLKRSSKRIHPIRDCGQ